MLTVLAWVYLTGGDRSFMIMYVTFMIVSILFDTLEFISMPASNQMTSGEQFGSWVWIMIFALKPIIVGTMIAYDLLERNKPDADGAEGNAWTQFTDGGQPGVGYDDDDYYDDEKVAA